MTPFRFTATNRNNLCECLDASDIDAVERAEGLITWFITFTSSVKASQGQRSKGRAPGDPGLTGRLRKVSRCAEQLHGALWEFLNPDLPFGQFLFLFPDLFTGLRPRPGGPEGEGQLLGLQEFAVALRGLADNASFYADLASHPQGRRGRGRPPASLRRLLAARLVVLFLDHFKGDPNSREVALEEFVGACFGAAKIPVPEDRFLKEWLLPVVERYDQDSKAVDIAILRT